MSELLSVVIPTHNRPDRLGAAVRSVLDQDYGNVEVLVVDDGSGPETSAALDRLTAGDRRIVVVRNEMPVGSSEARNIGIRAASGELLAFCDDDDAWVAGAASAAVGQLRPGVAVAYGFHEVLIEATGRRVTFRPPACTGPELMRWINVPSILSGIARRATVGSELHFDPALVIAEDWDLWLRCSELGPLALVPTPLYCYVQHVGHRVTRTPATLAEGRNRFLAKHRSSMTPACIAHHELTSALTARDRHAGIRVLGRTARHPSTLGSAALLAGEVVASHVGRRRRDPGLTLRFAARSLKRTTAPTRSGAT